MASETPEPGRASTLLPHPCTPGPYANQAKRIWFKLHTKYGGDVSKVTDCARISIELTSAEALEEAANFLLQGPKKVCSFKNRIANPTAEGYRDLLLNVLFDGQQMGEVQICWRPFSVIRLKSHAYYDLQRTMTEWMDEDPYGTAFSPVRTRDALNLMDGVALASEGLSLRCSSEGGARQVALRSEAERVSGAVQQETQESLERAGSWLNRAVDWDGKQAQASFPGGEGILDILLDCLLALAGVDGGVDEHREHLDGGG